MQRPPPEHSTTALSRLIRHPIAQTALVVWALWLTLMFVGDHWGVFATDWIMSIVMACGSFIAGATSEGGGAVAFPVMTLILKIEPPIARDFSLMIQSIGMIAASIAIVRMRIPVETRAILYASLGGTVGVIVSLEVIAPRLPPPVTKMFFTSFWLSFGVALYWMNAGWDRELHTKIEGFNGRLAALLFAIGILGGMVSGLTGSGLDIVTFSLLVLCFRLDEKIATPTSVVLMGINALVGFMWKLTGSAHALSPDTWRYWYACVPIVVVGAPLGAWVVSRVPRPVVVYFLLSSIAAQFVASLLIVPQTASLVLFSTATVSVGAVMFLYMNRYGERRLARLARQSSRGADAATDQSD